MVRKSHTTEGLQIMKQIFATLCAVLIIVALCGCDFPSGGSITVSNGSETVKGNGIIKTEHRKLAGFSKIEANGGFKIAWSSGKPGLSVTGDENILPLIKTTVKGDTLTIESEDSYEFSDAIVITLSSEYLKSARLNGGMALSVKGLKTDELQLEVNGASKVTLDGAATNFRAQLNGASELDAKALKTQTSDISMAGAGHGYVNASKKLTASVAGVGMLKYTGNPESVSKNVAGLGSIESAD
jgi:hypothetical protein